MQIKPRAMSRTQNSKAKMATGIYSCTFAATSDKSKWLEETNFAWPYKCKYAAILVLKIPYAANRQIDKSYMLFLFDENEQCQFMCKHRRKSYAMLKHFQTYSIHVSF